MCIEATIGSAIAPAHAGLDPDEYEFRSAALREKRPALLTGFGTPLQTYWQ
jgi:hypothetical protein